MAHGTETDPSVSICPGCSGNRVLELLEFLVTKCPSEERDAGSNPFVEGYFYVWEHFFITCTLNDDF